VRLYSRPGNDLTKRFPLIVEGLAQLRLRSCIIDGEAVAFGALSGLDQVEEPAPAVKREAEEDWGGRSAKPFPPVTMGHIRAHGCRDLLVYCGSGRWHQARGLARIASPMICRCVTLPADGLHPMRYDSR